MVHTLDNWNLARYYSDRHEYGNDNESSLNKLERYLLTLTIERFMEWEEDGVWGLVETICGLGRVLAFAEFLLPGTF
jgi:hypothetical protein